MPFTYRAFGTDSVLSGGESELDDRYYWLSAAGSDAGGRQLRHLPYQKPSETSPESKRAKAGAICFILSLLMVAKKPTLPPSPSALLPPLAPLPISFLGGFLITVASLWNAVRFLMDSLLIWLSDSFVDWRDWLICFRMLISRHPIDW